VGEKKYWHEKVETKSRDEIRSWMDNPLYAPWIEWSAFLPLPSGLKSSF
jgi:hypothetical protein